MRKGLLSHCLGAFVASAFFATVQAQEIGDGPIVKNHMSQSDIEAGRLSFDQIFQHGKLLFLGKFNSYDGQGRPATTGGGAARVAGTAPHMLRTSAPDANACGGCHNDPFPGSAGDFVANVFVLAQTLDPVTESVSGSFSNERNTLGMNGSGLIEMLSREMTAELHAARQAGVHDAMSKREQVTKHLYAKGVHFGHLVIAPNGDIDTTHVVGVNADLIVRPFHQKGVVVSLREFTNNAMNHHHGMQSVERFGVSRTGSDDFDQDGVPNELTVGDITANTIWQAAINIPGQVIPNEPGVARAIVRGERTFSNIGCGDCHVPFMTLNSPNFSEPNPYNPAGNLQVADVAHVYSYDMTQNGELPLPEKTPDGRIIVRAFTDLKRHNLCDEELNHFCNEQVPQGGVDTKLFLTRKLWDVGNTAPYGHRGDLSTITEAIWYHGGEARTSRDTYFALSQKDQDEVVEFLKSLRLLPPGTPSLVVDEHMQSKRGSETARQTTASGVTTR